MPRAHDWLSRNNVEWLAEHQPPARTGEPVRWRTNELCELDSTCVTLIPGIAEKLRQPNPVTGHMVRVKRQAIINKLLEQIGLEGYISPLRDGRMPMTERAITQELDEDKSFYERKLLYERDKFIALGKLPSSLKLLNNARVRGTSRSPEILALADKLCLEIARSIAT